MTRRTLPSLAIAALLHGCAVLPESAPSPLRLDSYRDRHFTPRQGTPLEVDAQTLRGAFDLYLAEGRSEKLRGEIIQRLTDLEVEGVLTTAGGSEDYRAAIDRYETLLSRTTEGMAREALLYGLARALAQQGEVERQLEAMAQLLREFPRSAHRTELEFRSGELLFAARRYGEAATFYEAVVANQAVSGYQEKGRYKLAWSHYRRHHYDEAVTRFLEMFRYRITPQMVAHGETLESLPLSAGDRALLADVVRGAALAASAADDPQLARRFATERDAPYAYLVYGALVERYVEQDRYHDAAEAAREFVQRWPRHRTAAQLQLRLLEVIAMGGFTARLEQERGDFVRRYHPQGEHWHLLAPAMRAELAEPLQTTLIGLAQRQHARAQQSRTRDDYSKAIDWYRSFLDGFPDHGEAWRMSFLLGNALYENGRYGEAAPAYEKSAYHYPLHEKSADAGHAALLAYRRHEATLAAGEFRDQWHWLGISSALAFINRFPNEPRTTPLLASTAQELYTLHRYQRASDVARLLLVRQPAPEPAMMLTAWTVLGYSEFELGHYEEAERAYREVLAMTDAKDRLRAQRIEWLAAAIYKQAEEARDNGQPMAAAAHFMRVGELVPDTKIRITSDYDAATSMIVAERWPEAITLLLKFRDTYRNSPLQNSVSEKLAVAYMRDGRHREAAREFEAIAAKRADTNDKREALQLAADLYEQAGDDEAQLRLRKRYIKEYPQPLEPAIEAYRKLALLADKRGDSGARDQWYQKLIAFHDQHPGEQSVRSRFVAASAQLSLARPQFAAFDAVQLTEPLQQSLQRKKQLMEEGLAAFGKVLDYNSAETTTEATWHIAEMQRRFGRALLESQRPANLNSEELEQYELMLEERAYPFEENAIEVHASNLARVPHGIYDAWVKGSIEALAELSPARYARTELGSEVINALR